MNIAKGKAAQKIVVQYLQKHNYLILDQNLSTKFGEIDILARDKNTLVFVEVKSKLSLNSGEAAEQVTPRKLRHMVLSSQAVAKSLKWENEVRLDLICVEQSKISAHIQNLELS